MRALRWGFMLHALMLVLLMASGLAPAPMLGVLAALALSWLWLRRHPALGFGRAALVRLVWHTDERWTLHLADGRSCDAELLPDSIVHPMLVVLRFRAEDGRKLARLIDGTEAEPELLRRLRARLGMR